MVVLIVNKHLVEKKKGREKKKEKKRRRDSRRVVSRAPAVISLSPAAPVVHSTALSIAPRSCDGRHGPRKGSLIIGYYFKLVKVNMKV